MRIRTAIVTTGLAAATVLGGATAATAAPADGPHGAAAEGAAVGSPGVLSGNNVQVPISVPINVCGNTVNVIALLNPAFGNVCANH